VNVAEILKELKTKEKSIVQLTTSYLAAIQENQELNAVIEINPDALAIAQRLDRMVVKGPLHGIPVLVKDNISTGDQMKTSTGSLALADNVAKFDAPIIKRLREAGAVIIGKTNLTEFSNFMTDAGMPNGYSSRGGQTISTFGMDVDTSGSSSGSAVAIAAGLAPLSVGTETCGSIICPAQNADILGLKPTIGAVPNEGIIPISHTLDTAGPMAKTAEGLKILFEVMADQNLEIPESLKGITIGVIRKLASKESQGGSSSNENLEESIKSLALEGEKHSAYYEAVIDKLTESGVNVVELEPHSIDTSSLYPLIFHEFKYAINHCLEKYANTEQNTLSKIIAYNESHSDATLRYGQNLLIDVEEKTKGDLSESEYQDALLKQKEASAILNDFFKRNKVDVLFSFVLDVELAAFTGNPSLTVPIKEATGIYPPPGAFFIGQPNDEALLIKIAEQLAGEDN